MYISFQEMGKLDVIQWTTKSVNNTNDRPPIHACFGLYPKLFTANRFIYKGAMLGDDLEKPEISVVKARRFKPGTERYWQGELDQNRYSTEMSVAFTDQTLAAKIDIVDQYLAPLHGHTKWDKVCLKMKPRYFRRLLKFEIVLIENAVRNLQFFDDDKTLDAFSHFSYSQSNEQSLLHSFKGSKTGEGKYLLLTPKMYTHKFDIHMWFKKHTCNNICGKFKRPIDASEPDKPTDIGGKFKRPIDASQPDKPTDIGTDAMFYNFESENKPINEKEKYSSEKPNETGDKYVNLETTFGAKSCEGTYSVVTAVVHSENEGKYEPLSVVETDDCSLNNESCPKYDDVTSRHFIDHQKHQYNDTDTKNEFCEADCLDGNGVYMENSEEFKENDFNKSDIENQYLQSAILARNENGFELATDELDSNENDTSIANVEASTLVIRQHPYVVNATDRDWDSLVYLNENGTFLQKKTHSSSATESDLNVIETISTDTSLQDRDACFDTLNHSMNAETEVYLQNTEILPNLELESKMHIDSNDIVEDTSSQPNIEEGQLTTESKDDNSHVSVDQTMSCREPQRAINDRNLQNVSQCDIQEPRKICEEESILVSIPDISTELLNADSMDISEHTSLLCSDIQNQQDKTQQTLNTEQMISSNDSNQLILLEEQDTNDDTQLPSHIYEESDITIDQYSIQDRNSQEPDYSESSTGEVCLEYSNTTNGQQENNSPSQVIPQITTGLESKQILEVKDVCLLQSKPQLQVSEENEHILFDFNENPDNDVNRPANPDFLIKYNLQNFVDTNEKEVNKDIPSTQQTNKETNKDIPSTQQTNKETNKDIPSTQQTNKETNKDIPSTQQTNKETNKDIPSTQQTNKETNKDIPSTQQTNKETNKDIPTTQQTNKETSAIEIVVDERNVRNTVHETVEPAMVPKPLQSSLRSGKKPSGRNVKFADDVIKQEIFIDRLQTENILLQKSPNLTSVVTRTCPNQTNSIILESLQADVNLMDPNWYSHIPCECCDNENITGRD